MTSPGEYIFAINSYPATAIAPKAEEEIEPLNILSKRRGIVAARLRSLRSDDPLSKGQPRSIEQELETLKTFQTDLWTIKFIILSI